MGGTELKVLNPDNLSKLRNCSTSQVYFVGTMRYNKTARTLRGKDGRTGMGYTHYWNVVKPLDADAFADYSRAVKKIKDLMPGTVSITANNAEVVINGKKEETSETFVLQREDSGFDFCKTRRYPYDAAVVAALVLAKVHFGDAIRLNSDGTEANWAAGKLLAETITGIENLLFRQFLNEDAVITDEELHELAKYGGS